MRRKEKGERRKAKGERRKAEGKPGNSKAKCIVLKKVDSFYS